MGLKMISFELEIKKKNFLLIFSIFFLLGVYVFAEVPDPGHSADSIYIDVDIDGDGSYSDSMSLQSAIDSNYIGGSDTPSISLSCSELIIEYNYDDPDQSSMDFSEGFYINNCGSEGIVNGVEIFKYDNLVVGNTQEEIYIGGSKCCTITIG
jgi:hypothetical protein